MVVLAADVAASAIRSNFRIDVAALASSIGAVPARLHSPDFAVDDTIRAYRTAVVERQTVVLALPLDVQAGECPVPSAELLETARAGLADKRDPLAGPTRDQARGPGPRAQLIREAAGPEAANRLAGVIREAKRPVFIAGRGSRNARARTQLEQLAERCGALLATSAAAKGLFHGSPWDLDVSGGFASPLAAELIRGADLVVGWGCSLNMWTMRHGSLISPGTVVAQVDDEPSALGGHRPINLGVLGDIADVASDVSAAWGDEAVTGYRADEVRKRIEDSVRWRDVPFTDESDGRRIDPRALTIALDDMLPAERIVAIDSGNFMGYPSMYLSVPDADGFCFTQAYQSIGLGLGSAIGSAIARPDRLVVAALGDGGALMGVSELETVVRLGLPLVVVVYDDEAYGAEVHHFGPDGYPLDTVRFPPVNIAKIARGFGFTAIKVRQLSDLSNVREWLDGPRDEPLLIDAKVTSERGSWWLEEAFRGH
jgi:thiamine pyrophosphate-dependent acetolactate synthase large subunit-like protein